MTVNKNAYFRAFKSSITRIYHANEAVVGAGFLVSNRYVLTCAHVITQALSIAENTSEAPSDLVDLDFPLIAPGQKIKAKVIFWKAVRYFSATSTVDAEDIAGLELQSELPSGAEPVRLITADDLYNHTMRVFGFPNGHDDGVWAGGVLSAERANKWVQMEAVIVPGYQVEPGFSGAPVWDETLAGVVGMAVAVERQREGVKSAFMIPTKVLSQAWSELNQSSNEGDVNSPVLSPVKELKCRVLKKRLEILEADYQAAYNQLNYTLNASDRNKIKRQCEAIEQEISEVVQELNSLGC